MKKILIISFLILIFITCKKSNVNLKEDSINNNQPIVKISNKGDYYKIIINVNNANPEEVGKLYGEKVLKVIPDYEEIVDSYLFEMSKKIGYQTLLARVNNIKQNINIEYRKEIKGFAGELSGGRKNIQNDGKISEDELFLLNFIPDVLRGTRCSAFSVFNKLSATGKTITGRNLDWYAGSNNQLTKLNAVIIYKNKDKYICSIGYIGFMGICTGISDNNLFGAILDSPTGNKYISKGKKSYSFDLRYALEHFTTLKEISEYLTSNNKNYTFGHLIFLSNPSRSIVVENNIINNSKGMIRDCKSVFNKEVEVWPKSIEYSIGAVNSFILKNNINNHIISKANTERWKSMIKIAKKYSSNKITLNELKKIISFDNNNGPGSSSTGDIYNSLAQQVIIFQPDTLNLEIYFRPKNGKLNKDPIFKRVNLNFD